MVDGQPSPWLRRVVSGLAVTVASGALTGMSAHDTGPTQPPTAASLLQAATAQDQPDPARPWTRGEYERFLRRWVEPLVENHPERAVVIGVVDTQGQHVFGFGSTQPYGRVVPNGNTLFDIGSITKVFTSHLLADMVDRGEVALTDPVQRYVPFVLPRYGDVEITLEDLATHTSALPRDAFGALRALLNPDPFGAVEPSDIADRLRTVELSRAPGSKFEYSNLGVGLLGYALAGRLGMSYEQALRSRVLDPLGMHDTRIALDSGRRDRVPQGFNVANYRSLPWAWEHHTLAAAGALRSTANDMLRFLKACLDAEPGSRMERLLALTLPARRPAGDASVGLGWLRLPIGDLTFHDGSTLHHTALVLWSPGANVGVVVLSNLGSPPYGPAFRLMSAMTETAYDPRVGLNKLAGVPEPLAIRPRLRFNRVHGRHWGLAADLDLGPTFNASVGGGYSGDTDRWEWDFQVTHQYGAHRDDRLELTAHRGVRTRWRSASKELGSSLIERAFSSSLGIGSLLEATVEGALIEPSTSNSVGYLFGREDFFDYYHADGVTADVGRFLDPIGVTLRAGLVVERHTHVTPQTAFLPGRDSARFNPRAADGRLRSLTGAFGWNLIRDPLMSVGQRRLVVAVEHSEPGFLSSAFDFTKLSLQLDWRLHTSRAKPFATTLDTRLIAATYRGRLPIQRFEVVEPSIWAYDLGVLRTLEGRPLEGDRYLGLYWEHNFRGVVLQHVGLSNRGTGMELILEGAHARTWLSPANRPPDFVPRVTDGWFSEVGLSFNGILGLLRVGFTKRIAAPGYSITLSSPKPY